MYKRGRSTDSTHLSEIYTYIHQISEQNQQNFTVFERNLCEINQMVHLQSKESFKIFAQVQGKLPNGVVKAFNQRKTLIEEGFTRLKSYLERFLDTLEEFRGNATLDKFSDIPINQSSIHELNVDHLEAEIISLGRQNELLREQIKTSEEKSNEINKKCMNLIVEIDYYSQTVNQLKHLAKTLNGKIAELESKDFDMEKRDNDLKALKEQVIGREKIISELENKSEAFEEIARSNGILREEIEKFQKKVKSIQQLEQKSLNNKENEVARLRAIIESQESEILSLQGEIKKKSQNTEKNKLKLPANNKNLIENLQLENRICVDKNKDLMNEIESIYQEIASKDKEFAEVKKTNALYQKQINSLKFELASLKSMQSSNKFDKIKVDLQSVRSEFQEFKSYIKQEISFLYGDFKLSLRGITLKVQEALSCNFEQPTVINLQAERLANELQEQKAKSEDLQKELSQAQTSIESFEKNLKNLLNFLPGSLEKTCQQGQQYFKLLSSIILDLSLELDESNPECFTERIGEIKDDRDSSYLEVQKLSGILNELEEFSGISASKLLNYMKSIETACRNQCKLMAEHFTDSTESLLFKIVKKLEKHSENAEKVVESLRSVKERRLFSANIENHEKFIN